MCKKERSSLSNERKDLLLELEKIIGNNCYNGNIQNFGPYGEWEDEGRYFRYPIVFKNDQGEEFKVRYTHLYNDQIYVNDVIMTGAYKFGANKLGIIEGIHDILKLLEKKYNLNFDKLEKQYQESIKNPEE